jgi:hypothetical protein
MKKLLIILFLFMIGVVNAQYHTYYVATTGNDNASGDITHPWATWQKGFETAEAGDTVYFRGGIWYPVTRASGNNIIYLAPPPFGSTGHNGTAEHHICFFNYPGESPIIDCSSIDTVGFQFNTVIMLYFCNYMKFKGLEIRNMVQPTHGGNSHMNVAMGISAWDCSNISYENMVIHDIGGRGWYHMSAFGVPYDGTPNGGPISEPYDSTFFINCDAYNIADMESTDPGNAGDGFHFQNYTGAYFYCGGCRSWNNSDDGFDMGGSCTGIIENCWSWKMGFPGALDGNGFKFGGVFDTISQPARIVRHCLTAFNSGSGFFDVDFAPNYRTNSRIYNNTAYKCHDFGFVNSFNAGKPWELTQYRNNIAYVMYDWQHRINGLGFYIWYNENHNTWDATVNNQAPFNIMTDSVTVTDADFILTDSISGIAQMGSARKADHSLPDITFMHLAPGSDLIDAGTTHVSNVTVTYHGAAPDLGAFEYGSALGVGFAKSKNGNFAKSIRGIFLKR